VNHDSKIDYFNQLICIFSFVDKINHSLPYYKCFKLVTINHFTAVPVSLRLFGWSEVFSFALHVKFVE
jgi:hypothetical protein